MQVLIPKIDPKVFKYTRSNADYTKTGQVLRETPTLPIITGTSRDKGGGILIHYENIPYPRKGFPDAEIINQVNAIKKITFGYLKGFVCKANIGEYIAFTLKPWFLKKKSVEKFLEGYCNLANYFLQMFYYQDATKWGWGQELPDYQNNDQYYCLAARELELFLTRFLVNLGFRMNLATNFAEVGCMFIENDDKYKMEFQDLMSESTKELMMNPFKEIPRLAKMFFRRDKSNGDEPHKFKGFEILSLVFLHPKIKKAWKDAMKEVEFSNWQFDKTDRYWALTWGNYDAMGRSFEDRRKEYDEIHKNLNTPFVKVEFDKT